MTPGSPRRCTPAAICWDCRASTRRASWICAGRRASMTAWGASTMHCPVATASPPFTVAWVTTSKPHICIRRCCACNARRAWCANRRSRCTTWHAATRTPGSGIWLKPTQRGARSCPEAQVSTCRGLRAARSGGRKGGASRHRRGARATGAGGGAAAGHTGCPPGRADRPGAGAGPASGRAAAGQRGRSEPGTRGLQICAVRRRAGGRRQRTGRRRSGHG